MPAPIFGFDIRMVLKNRRRVRPPQIYTNERTEQAARNALKCARIDNPGCRFVLIARTTHNEEIKVDA